jgi:membrane fusion protein (multidrug efflux system)
LLRRHFFLVAALGFVLLIGIVGAFKLIAGPGGDAQAQAGASGKGGGKGGKGGGSAGRAPQVTVVQAQMHTFTDRIDVIGVAKARQSVTLTSDSTELVTALHFTSGATVARGTILAELKADEQKADVINAQAAVEKARRDNERWQELSKRGFAPRAQVDLYQAAYDQAKANLSSAQARMRDRVIRAPFSGTVGLSDAAPGMLITPGTPIATLDDLSVVYVDFELPERYMGTVGVGAQISATAEAWAGQAFTGRISKIDTRVKADTRSVVARAEFANPGARVKPGMLMKVAVDLGVRNSVSVPEAAVQFVGDQPSVFLIAAKGKDTVAKEQPVVVGSRDGGFVEITSGLTAGQKVVGDGLNRIQGGQAVKVAGGKPAARAAS